MAGVRKPGDAKGPAGKAAGAVDAAPSSLAGVFPSWELVANEKEAPGAVCALRASTEPWSVEPPCLTSLRKRGLVCLYVCAHRGGVRMAAP